MVIFRFHIYISESCKAKLKDMPKYLNVNSIVKILSQWQMIIIEKKKIRALLKNYLKYDFLFIPLFLTKATF